jgi:hypothetical protein
MPPCHATEVAAWRDAQAACHGVDRLHSGISRRPNIRVVELLVNVRELAVPKIESILGREEN